MARPGDEGASAQLLMLPRLLFAIPPRSGNDEDRNSATKVVANRLRKAWAGDWADLWAESARPGEQDKGAPQPRRRRRAPASGAGTH